MAGRWKANNDGSAYYDSADSGPDQVQGMPAGGPALPPSQGPGQGSSPSWSGGPAQGPDAGGAGAKQPTQPGWGPIKISGSYNPHPNSPGDFWSHIGQMGPAGPAQGQGGGQTSQDGGGQPGQGPLPNPGGGGVWNDYKGQGGQLTPAADDGWGPRSDFPLPGGPYRNDWTPRGPDGNILTGGVERVPQVDPSRYDPNLSYDDYARDYHAPDRNSVLRDMPNQPMMHLMNDDRTGIANPEQGNSSDLLKQLIERAQQQKQGGGHGGSIFSLLGGAGRGMI